MPTLSPVYLPYKDGTRSVQVLTARHADSDIESCLSISRTWTGHGRWKWLQPGMQMLTLSRVYLPYKGGTRWWNWGQLGMQMPTLSSVYLPYQNGTRSVEVVSGMHADADIESRLSTVQGRDTNGGSGYSQACKC
jgi:hypothetical protein